MVNKNRAKVPLISCLCLTHNKAFLLERAIKCYQAQTYPIKELIIVYKDNDLSARSVVEKTNLEEIIPIEVSTSPPKTLGELRNLSIERCNGDYFCQWDDDDWYHKSRLEVQLNAALNNWKPVCLLTFLLMFDMTGGQAYLSHLNLWEGSILGKKSIVTRDIKYADKDRGEDTPFINKLSGSSDIYPLVKPNMYIYVYHGANTWGYNHFKSIFLKSQALSTTANILIKDILAGKYTVAEASQLLDSPLILEPLIYITRNMVECMQ